MGECIISGSSVSNQSLMHQTKITPRKNVFNTLQNYVSTLRQKHEEENLINNIVSDIPRLH